MRMKATRAIVPLIKHFEGCELDAHKCPAGIWSIGYGHTGSTTGIPVAEGLTITMEEADRLFDSDFKAKEDYANRLLMDGIAAGVVTQRQFDMFVSFAYNVRNAHKSTLKRLLNEGISDADLMEWLPKYRNPGSHFEEGLKRRRYAELLYALNYDWSILESSGPNFIGFDLNTSFGQVLLKAKPIEPAPVKKPLSTYSKPIEDLDVDRETAKPLEDSRRVKGVVREKAGDEVAKIGGVVSAPVAVGIAERLATSKPVNEFLILAAVLGVAAIVYGLIKRGYGKAQREAGEAEASQLLF